MSGAAEGDCYYAVENIVDKKTEDGVVKYLIKWQGYDSAHNTWEPEENIAAPDMIAEFEERRRGKQQQQGQEEIQEGHVGSTLK